MVSHGPAEKWYARPGVALCGQFAVAPELQRRGHGSKLMDFVERRAAAIGASELALDTSERADHLIRFYTNRGYRFVEYIQHEGETYRSAIFSKTLSDEVPNEDCLAPYVRRPVPRQKITE
jgi:ribosomal protein S18 acetylase RimI-like enzyme